MAFTKNVNVFITLIIFAIIVIDEYSNANENSDAIGPEEYCNNGGFKLPLATKFVERRKEFISSIKFPFNLSHSTDNSSLDQLKQKLKSKLVEESTSTSSLQEINPDNAKNFEFRQNQHDKSIQEEHDTNYNLNTESELSFTFKFDEVKKVPIDYTQLLKERSQIKDHSSLNQPELNINLNIDSNLAESSYGTDGFNPGVTNSSDFNQHQLNYPLSEEYERYYNSNAVFDLPLEFTPYDDTRNPIDSTEFFNVHSQPAAIKNPIEFLYTNTPSSTTYAPNYQSHYYKSNNDPTL